ncbi:phosphatase PAP2 family protein [Chitinibacteraceae bacterium HSL-7]
MSQQLLARTLSIAGHPALLMPLAICGAGVMQGSGSKAVVIGAMAALGVALCTLVFSMLRVRGGHWEHVDASHPSERSEINRFLAPMLCASAVLAWFVAKPVAIGLLLGAAIVATAQVLRRVVKLSQHVAFAMYATALMAPVWPAVLLLSLFTAGVAWSRLALGRHTQADVIIGALAGSVAGAIFHGLLRTLAAQ